MEREKMKFSPEEVRELIPDVEGQSGWGDLITRDSGPKIRDALLAFAELLEWVKIVKDSENDIGKRRSLKSPCNERLEELYKAAGVE